MRNIIATVDLAPLTDELESFAAVFLVSAPLVFVAAMAAAALFFGGKSLWRFFKSFVHDGGSDMRAEEAQLRSQGWTEEEIAMGQRELRD